MATGAGVGVVVRAGGADSGDAPSSRSAWGEGGGNGGGQGVGGGGRDSLAVGGRGNEYPKNPKVSGNRDTLPTGHAVQDAPMEVQEAEEVSLFLSFTLSLSLSLSLSLARSLALSLSGGSDGAGATATSIRMADVG